MSKSNSSETTEEQQEALDRQPFMAHLIEFRDRVLRIFISTYLNLSVSFYPNPQP